MGISQHPADMTSITRASVCPHDCPSTCALEIEVIDGSRIGAVRGAAANSYTDGVICGKVSRYAERTHHPARLTVPLLRTGPKGSGQFREIGWDEALDRTAERFAALACAVMHVAFRDGFADRAFMARYADVPEALEAHLATRTPEWASAITGLAVADIEAFARLYCETTRAYIRVGYGFTRMRNGAAAMHAVTCLPTVTGKWAHKAAGAFWSNRDIYHWNKTLIEGLDAVDPATRTMDMSRIGAVLTGDRRELGSGPEVHGLLIQNTNPVVVAPNSGLVLRGFQREDLFTVVHEQFMTETAAMADIVLPATMFMEHDDLYQAGGHSHIQIGAKLIDPPGLCRSNHEVLQGLAARLGARHAGFDMTAAALADATLRASGWPGMAEIEAKRWLDAQPDFDVCHFSFEL